MLKDLISYIGSCVDCKSKDITLEFVDSNVKGYAAKFSVKCIACDWEYSFSSSPEFMLPGRDPRGAKSQEVNIRTVMAFREIGKGHEGMKIFSTIMNMPPPMSLPAYNDINSNLLTCYEAAASASMKNAVSEVRNEVNPTAAEDEVVDMQIGIDGSWQKRGHSSKHSTR